MRIDGIVKTIDSNKEFEDVQVLKEFSFSFIKGLTRVYTEPIHHILDYTKKWYDKILR
ncbi:MAG: hypothetical protein WC755_07860 [Candidatus Woesearchaeota archaeon]|jgi:hypothetical protein